MLCPPPPICQNTNFLLKYLTEEDLGVWGFFWLLESLSLEVFTIISFQLLQ